MLLPETLPYMNIQIIPVCGPPYLGFLLKKLYAHIYKGISRTEVNLLFLTSGFLLYPDLHCNGHYSIPIHF